MQSETGSTQAISIVIEPRGLNDFAPDYSYDATVHCSPYLAAAPLSTDNNASSLKWFVEIKWPLGKRPVWADNLSLTISDFRQGNTAVYPFSAGLTVERAAQGPGVDMWICEGEIQQGNDTSPLKGHYSYNIIIGHVDEDSAGEPGSEVIRPLHKIDPLLVLSG
jgi:hypothetical protein